jgi:hypothetical protein
MKHTTELARASLTDDHEVRIVRVRQKGEPELIVLVWPPKSTPIPSSKLPAITTTVVAVFAEARIQLAALRANRS